MTIPVLKLLSLYQTVISIFFFLLVTTLPAYSQHLDCSDALEICGNVSVAFNPEGSGNNDFLNSRNSSGCVPRENNVLWFSVEVERGGTLAFTLTPDAATTDYDFAVWGPDPDCDNLGSPLRCNSAAPLGKTGLSDEGTAVSEGPGEGSTWSRPIDAQADEYYIIMVDNWSGNGSAFELEWTGTAVLRETLRPAFDLSTDCAQISVNNMTEGCLHGISYKWSLITEGETVAESNEENPIFSAPKGGTYEMKLEAETPSGKTERISESFTIRTEEKVDFSSETNCDELKLTNESLACDGKTFSYRWTVFSAEGTPVAESDKENPVLYVEESGIYTVRLEARRDGTLQQIDKEVKLGFLRILNEPDTGACFEENPEFIIRAQTAGDFTGRPQWYDEEGNLLEEGTELILTEGKTVILRISNEFCENEKAIRVKELCEARFFVPEVFTPNADGKNDLFLLFGRYVQHLDFKIFNRWNEVVYRLRTEEFGETPERPFWDGTFKGKSVPDGVYQWTAEYYSPELPFKPIYKSGSFLLYR